MAHATLAENAARLKEGIAKQARLMGQLQQVEDEWLEVSEALPSLAST